jgi:hypothetical protein
MVTDEKFFSWLDGELDAAEAAQVEAAVATDPRLAERAAQHRAMQAHLKAAFEPLADAPVPEQLLEAVRKPPHVNLVDFAHAKKRRERHWPSVPQWGAMAATLAVGVLIGTIVPHQREAAPVEVQGGRLYAASALEHALDTELASAPSGAVRIGVTFRNQAGAICRSFTASASSGVACRDDGRWQLRGLFAAPEGQASDYRMAAGMDPNLAALVDSTMAGEPFDASQEKQAKQRGWK